LLEIYSFALELGRASALDRSKVAQATTKPLIAQSPSAFSPQFVSEVSAEILAREDCRSAGNYSSDGQ
jgi:hypothetical protein